MEQQNKTTLAPIELGQTDFSHERRDEIDTKKEHIGINMYSTNLTGSKRATMSLSLLGGDFVINRVKLYEGKNGPFLMMPRQKIGEDYKDVCYAKSPVLRRAMLERAVEEYNGMVQQQKMENGELEQTDGQAAHDTAAPAAGQDIQGADPQAVPEQTEQALAM